MYHHMHSSVGVGQDFPHHCSGSYINISFMILHSLPLLCNILLKTMNTEHILQIERLAAGTFDGLVNIQWLDLAYNQLKVLGMIYKIL